ncbi:hypothetical protein SAMN03159338_4243 [Sphingomonas sp. NFR04]|nr:hypothetical protein SAMN03159338_4243 [Sphingomonas sp. NFR04]
MAAKMLEILMAADHGYSRSEMKDALSAASPLFRSQIEKNVNTFYNNVSRYLKAGKIVDVEGYLYHALRAPSDDTSEDDGADNGVVRLVPRESRLDLGN